MKLTIVFAALLALIPFTGCIRDVKPDAGTGACCLGGNCNVSGSYPNKSSCEASGGVWR
jgi:hypothetical protein